MNKVTFKHVNNQFWLIYANSIGKHLSKKAPISEEDFASQIIDLAPNFKRSDKKAATYKDSSWLRQMGSSVALGLSSR